MQLHGQHFTAPKEPLFASMVSKSSDAFDREEAHLYEYQVGGKVQMILRLFAMEEPIHFFKVMSARVTIIIHKLSQRKE
jgi:hypothetical protein